jgi:DNA-binding CsgD family transcriptional regulator
MVTLYEREALVDELVSLVNRAGGHRPCVMFVSGEAGLGKTAVLTAAINSVPFDGQVQVASVQAPSVEAGIPFGLAVQLAEALDSSFSEATGNLAGLGPADARVARFMGMLDLVRRVAASRPLVLAVDDLHWADLDSLALLGFLVRRLRSQPTTIIATLRPFPLPAWEMASELVHDGIADVRSLSPLSTAAMQQMLDEAAAGPVPPGVVQRAAALSAGNPLLLEQLARSLRAGHGLPDRLPGGHRLGAFLARFAGVRELGLRYASATSVFGQSFRPSLAADVAQLSEQEAAEALAELCANGLLSQVRPGSVCFTHSLVRQAFYDELPAPVRARLHGRAFAVLRAAGAPLGECAEQAMEADLAGDRDAVETLTRAGVGSIETGAADAGRRYLTAAVGLARGHTDLRVRLAIGWASLMLGDSRAALDSAVELRGPGDDPDGLRREAARLRLHALVAAGRYREAVAGLTTAAGYLKKMYPADAATLLVEGSTLALPASGPATVRSMVATARRLSWADDAAGQRVMALEQLLDALACQRPADEAAPPGGILETGAVPGGPGPDARGWGPAGQPHGSPQVSQPSSPELQDSVVAYARLETDLASERFAATDVAYTEAAAVMAQAYVPRLRAMFDMAYAIGMARRGALRQAAVLFERASECDLSALTGLRSAIGRAYVLTELGQCDVAAEYCAQVRSRAGASLTDLPFLQLWLGRTKAVLALEADDVEGAVAEVRPLRGIAIGAGILEPCVVPWIDVAARALIAAEDLAAACDLLDWAATITAQLSCAWPRAVILGGRAELMARRGNLEGAIGLFDAALSCHQQQPLPLATVETLLTYGCVLRRAGRLSAARPLLLRGMQLAESCAAGRLAAACRRELRIADGRRRRRGEPDGALTASEARVIDLACTGLSNAEIARSLYVSVRTVESHMGHAYTKLGVASRRQLLALAMTKDVPRRVLASGRPLSSYPGPG